MASSTHTAAPFIRFREVAPSAAQLEQALVDARSRTLRTVDDLTDAQLSVPQLATLNPLRWELGHVAWFQEHWCLQRKDRRSRAHRDALYDSSHVPHASRWTLPLPDRTGTLRYLDEVLSEVRATLAVEPTPEDRYFLILSLFHEDMHGEALCMTRQTVGYPSPFGPPPEGSAPEVAPGDVELPGGRFVLGAPRDAAFVFDNEKWAHEVEVAPFAIARFCVTQAEFAAFVDDGGYAREALWSPAGWKWRKATGATAPVYWRRGEGGWWRRHFDTWRPLEPTLPVVHVSAHEAEAYCRWANRRLPTELEWTVAAQGHPVAVSTNLDGERGGAQPVNATEAGESTCGCQQMIGNVWEWTASAFLPFDGFGADPYEDYSRPWFGTHRVLKGGAWMTRARLIHPRFRNFYTPERRDVFAGFRTCAP